MFTGELNLTQCGNKIMLYECETFCDIQFGRSLWLILTPEQVQALREALRNTPATLETFGKTQCNHCRKIVRVKEIVDSERYAAYVDPCVKHLCKECKEEMDKPCTCHRNCKECEDYWHCGGCKMPPCDECEANKHLKEAK